MKLMIIVLGLTLSFFSLNGFSEVKGDGDVVNPEIRKFEAGVGKTGCGSGVCPNVLVDGALEQPTATSALPNGNASMTPRGSTAPKTPAEEKAEK